MRVQRESLTSEIAELKSQNSEFSRDLNNKQRVLKNKDVEITTLNLSLLERQKVQRDIQSDLNNTMSAKEQELAGIRNKLKQWQVSIEDKDLKLTQ